jgi:hypothetical protein
MARMTWVPLAAALIASPLAHAAAQRAPADALTDTSGFERSYAASFYQFDACGGSLPGRLFRAVLIRKFAQCPFTAEARERFAQRTKAQAAKSSKSIGEMIIARGGLPVRLDGMTLTCHEFFTGVAYQRLRVALDDYVPGRSDPATIFPGPCDAADITP